jgi:CubicO group peptidase (beta-lactamase class C family)
VAKQFTDFAIILLAQRGQLGLDDDIREYLPEVPDFGTPITLRHLVHHVSGIRDQWNLLSMAGWRWEADVVTQRDVLEITALQTALNFKPGEQYLYSNTGFTLLAVVVERVTGQTLREFTTEHLFEPLGMLSTHFHDDHEMIVRNRAWAYAPDPEGTFGVKNSIPDFDVVGATSLYTTVHDLAAWDRNFYTGQVGGTEALDRLRQRFTLNSGDPSAYAHGLSLGSYRGLRTEGHGGADAGYRSNFLRFPDQRLSIAVLCNFPSANPGGRAQQVAEAYLSESMNAEGEGVGSRSSETVPISAARQSPLVGVYRATGSNLIVTVQSDDNGLSVSLGRTYPLRPIGEYRFEVVDAGRVLVFHMPDDGSAVVMEGNGLGPHDRVGDAWEATPAELEPYVGMYHSDELDTEYRIGMDDGALWVHRRKFEPQRLEPTALDGFTTRGSSAWFTHAASGEVDGFTLSDGRVWNVRFRRIEGQLR